MSFFTKKEKPNIAFLISGRGSNMNAILEKIADNKLLVNVCLVFSDNEQAFGLELAKRKGYPTEALNPKLFTTRNHYEVALLGLLQKYNTQLVVCAGYMRLIKNPILNAFPQRVLNIHPSLLPSFPGLKAQKQALDYGVKYTGCTVHFVDEGMDTGTILEQRVVPILEDDTEESLSIRILKEEHDLYWRVIKQVLSRL